MSHLDIAAKQGMKAGMKSYLNTLRTSGLEAVRDTYDSEWGVLNGKQQFTAYCAKFGPKVEGEVAPAKRTRFTRSTPIVETSFTSEIEAAKAKLAQLEADAREAAKAARKPAKVSTAKASKGTITAGEAWKALGSNPEFKPGNLSKPASSNMLWRLNVAGKLAL